MSYGWALPALLAWLIVLIAPWRAWSSRERLEADSGRARESLHDVTVLIPARNEVETLPRTLASLLEQGPGLDIVLVDDQSCDGTAALARRLGAGRVRVIHGAALPEGWVGKVWAQSQAQPVLHRPLLLLLDADIALAPGLVATLRAHLREHGLGLVSLMAALPMVGFWERLLLPAFVYFFKLIYPFRLANSPGNKLAAAAGGCVLLDRRALDTIGGFAALRDAIIDDCTLARKIKDAGYGTWIGLTRSVTSHRRYRGLGDIWRMVSRTAFTQLGYSWLLLAMCTLAMIVCFASPVVIGFAAESSARTLALGAWLLMGITYLPTLRFYGIAPFWALALPLTGMLFLTMTWDSARRYLGGERSVWRGRQYRAGDASVSR